LTLLLLLPPEEAAERPRGPFYGGNHIPVVAVRCDPVVKLEAVIPDHQPVALVIASDVSDRHVLVVIQRLGEPDCFLLE
jgi:hypothetical protein